MKNYGRAFFRALRGGTIPVAISLLALEHMLRPLSSDDWNFEFAPGSTWEQWGYCSNQTYAPTKPVRGQSSFTYKPSSMKTLINSCTGGQAVPDHTKPTNEFRNTTYRFISYGRGYEVPGPTWRMQYRIGFTRSSNSQTKTPRLRPPETWVNPVDISLGFARAATADPDILIPDLMYPDYHAPVPYEAVPYWTHPERTTDNGNNWNRPPGDFDDYYYGGGPENNPSAESNSWSRSITLFAGAVGLVGASVYNAFRAPPGTGLRAPEFHFNTPPGPGTRERKARMPGWMSTALRLYGSYTEAQDLVEAFYWSLPRERLLNYYSPRYGQTNHLYENPSLAEMMQALYENWEYVDLEQTMTNVYQNEFWDTVFGAAGQAGAQTSRNLGRSPWTGINSLLSDEASTEQNIEQEGYQEDAQEVWDYWEGSHEHDQLIDSMYQREPLSISDVLSAQFTGASFLRSNPRATLQWR